ncbi:MAG: hypothetical protein RKR03_12930 [Candidatus Competibacter sp.]|nr:hypothetical protein [Candidatus Competibacter sp.]MDS4070053.1 hypothetical protein [Candidatus Competibacter sp.]
MKTNIPVAILALFAAAPAMAEQAVGTPVGTVVGTVVGNAVGSTLGGSLGGALPVGIGGVAAIAALGLVLGVQLIKRKQK